MCIDNVIIEKVDTLKFVGIYVDNELRWNIHTHFIEKKVAGGLYALNSTKHMLPTALLRSLYFALINSYLQYGCLLWGNTYEKYLHKIKVSQKKAMRVICHATYNTPASPLFKMLNIINFEDLFKFQTCQFMLKLHTQSLPSPLNNIIKKNQDIHKHKTRHREDFTISVYKHNTVHRSLLASGPRFWYNIPTVLKCCNYKLFCKKMKLHLINN